MWSFNYHSHQYSFHHGKKFPCVSNLYISSHPLLLAMAHLFSVPKVLLFPGCHADRIT